MESKDRVSWQVYLTEVPEYRAGISQAVTADLTGESDATSVKIRLDLAL